MKRRVKVMVPVYLLVAEDDSLQLDIKDGEELQFIWDLESDAAKEYDAGEILSDEEIYE